MRSFKDQEWSTRLGGIARRVVSLVEGATSRRDPAQTVKQLSATIIQSLPLPLLALDLDLRVRMANPAFYAHFQVRPEETVGCPLKRRLNDPRLIRLLEALEPGGGFDDYLAEREFEHLGRRVMLLSARRPDGEMILLAIRDITRQHDVERALREKEDRLAAESQHKDDYLAMLGHELRNPLGAIRNATEVLRPRLSGDPVLGRAHAVLDRQTAHMSRIIDDLLDVSRIARGKIHLQLKVVDLHRVVDEVMEVRLPQATARGLELRLDASPEPLWVMGDDARLAQIFDNLVGNAIKFTPPRGSIVVSITRSASCAVVRVRDTGLGIDARVMPRLFEAFAQADSNHARPSGGLGLGLALAKGLTTLHGGTITARSGGHGLGAEFEVRVPLAAGPPEPSEVQEERESTPAARVLIVEDNPDAADMMRALCERAGHEVDAVGDAPQALDHLRRHGADVVLCDLGLPGMSGYDLARAIRADPSLARTRLVAVTGYGQPEDRAKAAAAGFEEHLIKPVGVDALYAVLRRLTDVSHVS